MKKWLALGCLACIVVAARLGTGGSPDNEAGAWVQVGPGVLRTAQAPFGYALVREGRALLVDAPQNDKGLAKLGVRQVEMVLLTHHHRDSCAAVKAFLDQGVKVRAPKGSAEWLTRQGVAKYWKESIPLRSSRTAYLVVPQGFDEIDCSLTDGQILDWRGWKIQVVATPGHSFDHVAYAAREGDRSPLLFCGDAFAAPGKLWSPYTTDWDHWTDAGLVPAANSLHKLAALKPAALFPAHGECVKDNATAALEKTAANVEEVGFLKSFERFTKKRLGNAPKYKYLAPEQAMSNGSLPWSQITRSLFVTGNTFVLTSRSGDFLAVDPWAKRSADQVLKLQKDRGLGNLEVVIFSHAHYDHYDGVYDLPNRDKFQVWMLDIASLPVVRPLYLRAPFLDPRPVRIDKKPRAGDTLSWREYQFRFHHLPGQSYFTMGMEVKIDGKRCYFTADNFFHQDMFSGSGGWMGLNRSWPLPYAESAKKVLDAAPEWVLAEHGGPFEFNAEDFRRRVRWGEAAAHAADVLSPSGNHRLDWDPNLVAVEPLVQKARAGTVVLVDVVASNPTQARGQKLVLDLKLRSPSLAESPSLHLSVPSGTVQRQKTSVRFHADVTPGRHVIPVMGAGSADTFFVVDIE
jgi:glyoxylase-like metal-dependent hydrolase (beta-lactamase superfamily II)